MLKNLRFFSHLQHSRTNSCFRWNVPKPLWKTCATSPNTKAFDSNIFKKSFSLFAAQYNLSQFQLLPKQTPSHSSKRFLSSQQFYVFEDLNTRDFNPKEIEKLENDIHNLTAEQQTSHSLNQKMMLSAVNKKLDYFNKFFERYVQLNYTLSVETVNAMMELASRYQRLDQTEKIFELAKSVGVEPDEQTFKSALRSCISSGNTRRAEEFFYQMEMAGIPLTESAYQELMLVYGLNHDPERSIRLLDSMKEESYIKPTQSTYLTIIDICLANHQPILAFDIINKLEKREFEKLEDPLSLLSYLLESSILLDDSKAIILVFQALTKFAKSPIDEGTIISGLQVAARSGDLQCANLLWSYLTQHLEKEKLKLSAEGYSVMVYCYIKGMDIKNATTLSQEKINQGYPLGTPLFKALGDLFSSSIDNLDSGYYVLEDLFKQGKPISQELFDTILFACSQSGETDRAFATFNEYPNFNFKPSINTYNYLLAACAHRWQLESSYLIFDQMEKAGVTPDLESHTQLLRSACRGAKLLDAKDVLDKIKSKGLKIKDKHYELVIRACIQFHKHYEMAELLLTEIKGPQLKSALVKELQFDKTKNAFQK